MIFAAAGATHTAVSPDAGEHQRIADYAGKHNVDVSGVTFVEAASDAYLPTADPTPLDFVLIDGKHAFPWPIIDWFFVAERVRLGGLVALDDVGLRAVKVLHDFLAVDRPRWLLESTVGSTSVFRKTDDTALNVGWDQQPWMLELSRQEALVDYGRRVVRKVAYVARERRLR
jgi:hypothetical protein